MTGFEEVDFVEGLSELFVRIPPFECYRTGNQNEEDEIYLKLMEQFGIAPEIKLRNYEELRPGMIISRRFWWF